MAYGDLVAESLTLRSEVILESRTASFASEKASHGHPLGGVSLLHPVLQASAGSGLSAEFVARGNEPRRARILVSTLNGLGCRVTLLMTRARLFPVRSDVPFMTN